MRRKPESRKVLVAGDITADWNLAFRLKDYGVFESERSRELGGAALLYKLIDAMRLCEPELDLEPESLYLVDYRDKVDLGRYMRSFVIWNQKLMTTTSLGSDDQNVWRADQFFGLNSTFKSYRVSDGEGQPNFLNKRSSEPALGASDVVVISDSHLGFERQDDTWPKALTDHKSEPPWTVIKTSFSSDARSGINSHGLIEYLSDESKYPPDRRGKTIIVANIEKMRRSGAVVSEGLSWERAIDDLDQELGEGGHLESLAHACGNLIITFETDGAVLISHDSEHHTNSIKLVYDQDAIEGQWAEGKDGSVLGLTSCMVGAVVRELLRSGHAQNLDDAMSCGLQAMRSLYDYGYGPGPIDELWFPSKKVAEFLNCSVSLKTDPDNAGHGVNGGHLRLIDIDADRKNSGGSNPNIRWSILAKEARPDSDCLEILKHGMDSKIASIPIARFGKLVTVDRQEIEGYRSIRSIVSEYCRKPEVNKPLSISVFGQPGAGKSFGIKQLLKSTGFEFEEITFNLSQFSHPSELLGAHHQVRDIGLRGSTPLVFWDEFDSSRGKDELDWLRYFLEPMQDGRFLEGQVRHPIGRAVFVFIGGTSSSLAEFVASNEPKAIYKSAKVPDFVSRLTGSISILGPNQLTRDNAAVKTPGDGVADESPRDSAADETLKDANKPELDPFWMYRRAISLRSVLQNTVPQLFQLPKGEGELAIDDRVAYALLRATEYKHGTRSIESVISMSRLTGRKRFEPAYLPDIDQLRQHVSDDFYELLLKGSKATKID